MARSRLLLLPLSLALTLAACGGMPPTPQELPNQAAVQSSSSVSSQLPRPATYQGQVQEAGISIYHEGTHRLVLSDGSFVLLEGEGVDLDTYLGQTVEVRGLERSTKQAGGLIIAVQSVTVLAGSSSSETASAASDVSSLASSVRAPVPSVSSASSRTQASSSLAGANPMAAYKADASTMTQMYCSSHAGFCMPVHKNGWWKAFGATGKALWHVEVSSQEITDLGQGPLAVDVIAGTVAEVSATDGQVVTLGDQAVGYRSFGDGKYIQVSAPLELQSLVAYTTRNLTLSVASSAASQSASQ